MPTELEYALMSGGSYLSTRDPRNQFPTPNGWTQLDISRDDSSGFEAVAFQQGTGTNPSNIVISFAGTNFGVADLAADAALGSGIFWSQQLGQAAAFYLGIRQNPLYSNSTISFTGHSLGGGLAALLGVFFNQQATTFDQAPFALSLGMRDTLIAHLKVDYGYTDQQLLALAPSLVNPLTPGNGAANVTDISVAGQLLATPPYSLLSTIGTEQPPLVNGGAGVSATDLHSQALLTLFVMSDPFRQATLKLTDLEKMLFDSNLYANDTGVANRTDDNFLERLVRHQNGNAPGVTTADAMLTRFTSDLGKLAQDGGLTMADDAAALARFVSKTLTAFAMQMYYEDTANATNANKELFTTVTGGVHFDRSDVSAALDNAKGYTLYFQQYLNSDAFTDNERQLMLSLLPTLRDWYVQAGPGGMDVADAHNRGAFMLGGNGVDNLTGGTQADLLVGNGGADTLNGGGGNDIFLGGAGFDTYVYNTGDGTDTIDDSDRRGMVQVDGQLGVGGLRLAGDPVNTFHSTDGQLTFVLNGTNLMINDHVIIQNWQPGELGLTLRDLSTLPTGVAPVIDYNNGLPGQTVTGDDSSNTYGPLGGSGALFNVTAFGNGGDDFIFANSTSAGNHQFFGGTGADRLEGALGHDRLFGEAGRDLLFGFEGDDVLEGGDQEDALAGGLGDDVLDGGAGDDALTGGSGADILRGGLGADLLAGDGVDSPLANMGADLLDGGAGADWLFGLLGDDVLMGGTDDDHLYGDTLPADSPSFTYEWPGLIIPAAAVPFVSLTGGADYLDGGAGNDYLQGDAGDDVLLGGAGVDSLLGDDLQVGVIQEGDDWLDGGAGNDTLVGGGGEDALFGGDDDDLLVGDYAGNATLGFADTLNGGAEDDVRFAVDRVLVQV